ncbi:leukocyte cell-derived chemotaxin 1-like [Branchiostoma floridae]|uniref:Leukocyte cell-derived chemotaxin 1-like n=1 Tax=Branchiostoma floridae TaxID=7739 RepID=A0A9J7N705_BRAFL|nr:leukocyte cell-derived chemotaxin 1-like [Branchiostoma floridae]
MTSYDEKKTLPPVEALPGGVFPHEIAAIKKKARGENASRLKIGIAVGSVVLVILAVVGGTLLGLHLNRKPNVVVRSVQLAIEDEIMEETVEVDKEKDTETFRTVSSTGTSFVFRDMQKSLSAYRFDGDEKCYILDESLEESKDTTELLEDLEKMEEGEVDVAERQPETFLSVDEELGHTERSVLSESMLEFCKGLKTHWAVKSSTETSPTPGATVEEDEAEADAEMEVEVFSGTNGTSAVQQREKRVVGTLVCLWVTHNVCSHTCRNVCGKRRRRALLDGEPDQEVKKRAKRGWLFDFRRVVRTVGRVVRRVVTVVCRAVCNFGCQVVRVKVCSWVG